jgi:hypothetical protein
MFSVTIKRLKEKKLIKEEHIKLAYKHNNVYKEKKINIENKNSSEQIDRTVRKLEIERIYFFWFCHPFLPI